MRPSAPIPVLRSFAEAKAREFYVDFLGFEFGFEHRFAPDLPLYMEVRRGDCVLHLSEHHGDACPGATLRVEVEDVDALCRELLARRYRHARRGVSDTPCGQREMPVIDGAGNRLVFYSRAAE